MNARKCAHAQKPYPSQVFTHESSKVGGRGKRETDARRVMERKAAQQNKNLLEELKHGLAAELRLTNQEEEVIESLVIECGSP